MANGNSRIGKPTAIPDFDTNKLIIPKGVSGAVQADTPKEGSIGQPQALVTPTEVPEAPVIPEVTPEISTKDVETAETEAPIFNRTELQQKVTDTVTKFGETASANEAFVRGSLKLAGQEENDENISKFVGQPLSAVTEQLGLSGELPDFGIKEEVVEEDKAMATEEGKVEATASASDQIKGLLETLPGVRGEAREGAIADTGLVAKSQAIADASTKANALLANVNKLKNEAEIAGIEDLREEDVILGKPLLKGTLNVQLSELSREQKFDKMIGLIKTNNAIDEYNAQLTQVQIAQGNFDRAETIVKDTADEAFASKELELNALVQQNVIEQDAADSLTKSLEAERDLQLDGYVPLEMTLDEAQKEFGRDKVFQDPVSKKIYKKPEPAPSELELFAAKKEIEALFNAGKITEKQKEALLEEKKSDVSAVAQAESALTIVDEIINIDPAILENVLGPVSQLLPTFKKSSVALENKIESLKNLLTLDNLGFLKGAMSDKDIAFITSASTTLDPRAGKEDFLADIGKIKDVMVKNKLKAGGYKTLDDYYFESNDIIQNAIDNTQLSFEEEFGTILEDEDLLNELRAEAKGFSTVGSDTKQASVNPSGRQGNRPQRNQNPGNVKIGGIGDKFALKDEQGKVVVDEQNHLVFPNETAGFNALKADVKAKITGGSRFVKSSNPTLAELGKVYAEHGGWARGVANNIGVDVNTKAQDIDFNKLIQAIARQEGFFA